MSRVLTGFVSLFVLLGVAWADAPKVVESQLSKQTVEQVLDAGPQKLIAGLRVEGHRALGKFVGFRIVKVLPDGPLSDMEALKVGDIIITVNGQSVERPDHFMKIWEGVRKRDTLEVRILRGVQPLVYRWNLTG